MINEKGTLLPAGSAEVFWQSVLGAAVFVVLLFFGFAVPARSTGECLDDVDCSAGSYCKKVDGDCEGAGICEGKPDVCLAYVEPVCGCDGLTYSNHCDAALAGISLMHNGKCRGDVAVLGTIYDKCEPWNDTLYVNLENCSGLSEAVEGLDKKMVTVQVGPLVMDIPGADFVLTKSGYFLYYHPGKMADEETTRIRLARVSAGISLYCGNTCLNGLINPIMVTVTIDGWFCGVTKEWKAYPYSVGIKYRTKPE